MDARHSRRLRGATTARPTLRVRDGIDPDRAALQDDVRYLQARLCRLGFPTLIDGQFGRNTESAVKAFQRAAGLDDDGIVGPKTWAALGSALRPANPPRGTSGTGDRPMLRRGDGYLHTTPHLNAAVGDLQELLAEHLTKEQRAAHGLVPKVDGLFGPKTEEGVRVFQQASGLSVDGIVGELTWAALVRGSSVDGKLGRTEPISKKEAIELATAAVTSEGLPASASILALLAGEVWKVRVGPATIVEVDRASGDARITRRGERASRVPPGAGRPP